eukprot:2776599-Rhodomonas_salina.1
MMNCDQSNFGDQSVLPLNCFDTNAAQYTEFSLYGSEKVSVSLQSGQPGPQGPVSIPHPGPRIHVWQSRAPLRGPDRSRRRIRH